VSEQKLDCSVIARVTTIIIRTVINGIGANVQYNTVWKEQCKEEYFLLVWRTRRVERGGEKRITHSARDQRSDTTAIIGNNNKYYIMQH